MKMISEAIAGAQSAVPTTSAGDARRLSEVSTIPVLDSDDRLVFGKRSIFGLAACMNTPFHYQMVQLPCVIL